jgi:hypothetical protein
MPSSDQIRVRSFRGAEAFVARAYRISSLLLDPIDRHKLVNDSLAHWSSICRTIPIIKNICRDGIHEMALAEYWLRRRDWKYSWKVPTPNFVNL